MIAKRLEAILAEHANRGEPEMLARFQKLRDNGLLPKSRGKNAETLTADQIAVSILSVVPPKPGYAGQGALVLKGLRPVGGVEASFAGASSLGEAIASFVEKPEALKKFVELRVSDDEIFTNAHGIASIWYRDGGNDRVSYFVPKTALTLMQKGAERGFDPRSRVSPVITEISFLPTLFRRIARERAEEQKYQSLLGRYAQAES